MFEDVVAAGFLAQEHGWLWLVVAIVLPQFILRWTGVLSSQMVGGEVRLKIGDPSREEGGRGADCPVWGSGPLFVSRPKPPEEDGQSALALYFVSGDQKIVLGQQDNRVIDRVGDLQEGDACIFGYKDQRVFVKDEQNSVSLYTVNEKTQDSMIIEVNAKEGQIRILNGVVGMIFENDGTNRKVTTTNGKTATLLNDDGFFVNGDHFGANTNGGNLGALAPNVPPLPPAMSIVVGPSGMVGVGSAKFTCVP